MALRTFAALAALIAAAPLAAQPPLRVGEIVIDNLAANAPRFPDGAPYSPYAVTGRAGDIFIIRMRSDDFDTVLHWGSGTGDRWAMEAVNDDWGDGTDSRLAVRLERDGTWELRAGAFAEGQSGQYALEMMKVGPAPAATPVRLGQTVEGRLEESDYVGEGGLEDHYAIEGPEGDSLTIYVESDEFDTYVTFGPWVNGVFTLPVSDDDGGRETNSELISVFSGAAGHRLVVRSYTGEETGAYTLRVVAGAHPEGWDEGDEEGLPTVVPTTDTVVTTTVTADSIPGETSPELSVIQSIGEPVTGWIGAGAREDLDCAFRQELTRRAEAGERPRIRVSPDSMHPYVALGTGLFHHSPPWWTTRG